MFNVANWIESGALFYLGDNKYLVACELQSTNSMPLDSDVCIYSPDFYMKSENPWHLFKVNQVFQKNQLLELIRDYVGESTDDNILRSKMWTPPLKSQFEDSFIEIKTLIEKNKLNKMVPVVFETQESALNLNELMAWIQNLLENSGEQSAYGLWDRGEGLLGLSPEILFNYENTNLTSMALAGTGLVTDVKGSLLADNKEMYEHQLVVDNLKQQFSKLGEVKVSETYEWSIDPLKHLRTDICVDLIKNYSKDNIELFIKSLHPTPALGVHPKSYPWKSLEEYDPVDRKKFGAPFGVLIKNKFQSLVSIRNIQWDHKTKMIGSGCGVVEKSILNKEWQELFYKRNSVKKYFGIKL